MKRGVNWREQDLDPMTLYTNRGGKGPWTVSQWFYSNPLSLQCRDVFLCNTCYRYSMLNGIVDSQKVRAQKAVSSSQSIGRSSFIPRHSKKQ
jgi:hypothetical protein